MHPCLLVFACSLQLALLGLQLPLFDLCPCYRQGSLPVCLCLRMVFSSSCKDAIHIGGGGLVTKLHPALATPWTVACQTLLSMGLPSQKYWHGLPFPSPANLSDSKVKPTSPAL